MAKPEGKTKYDYLTELDFNWESRKHQLTYDCKHGGGEVSVMLDHSSMTLLLVEGQLDERGGRLRRVPNILYVEHRSVAGRVGTLQASTFVKCSNSRQ